MSGARGPYHDGYANLAAAIIASGVRHHDKAFLESNWCDLLKDICMLDDQMYGDKNISTRGRSIISANKGGCVGEFN